jgi:hypothetical protein
MLDEGLDDWEFSTHKSRASISKIDDGTFRASKKDFNNYQGGLKNLAGDMKNVDIDGTYDIDTYFDSQKVAVKASSAIVIQKETGNSFDKPRLRPLHSDRPLLELETDFKNYPNPFESFLTPDTKKEKDDKKQELKEIEQYTPIIIPEVTETIIRRPSIKVISKRPKIKHVQKIKHASMECLIVDDTSIDFNERVYESFALLDSFEQLYSLI